MSLREKQVLFTKLLPRLLDKIYNTDGWEVTGGELLRTPEQAALYAQQGKGIKNSVHCDKLAIDLNFFFNGAYISDTAQIKQFGDYWESLNPLCRWGGNFTNKDGNHFSITDNGRA